MRILIAEDDINQTYYLGKVDYCLLNIDVARTHSILVDGRLVRQYTGAPVIGSGSELDAVIDATRDGQVYVIGSGQDVAEFRRRRLGNGISEALQSERFEVIYEGRDGKTKVWRLRR